jgi:hypothetical protein
VFLFDDKWRGLPTLVLAGAAAPTWNAWLACSSLFNFALLLCCDGDGDVQRFAETHDV